MSEPKQTSVGPAVRVDGSLVFTCPCRPDVRLDGLVGAGFDGADPGLYPGVGAVTLCINCARAYELMPTGWTPILVDALEDQALAARLRAAQAMIRKTQPPL